MGTHENELEARKQSTLFRFVEDAPRRGRTPNPKIVAKRQNAMRLNYLSQAFMPGVVLRKPTPISMIKNHDPIDAVLQSACEKIDRANYGDNLFRLMLNGTVIGRVGVCRSTGEWEAELDDIDSKGVGRTPAAAVRDALMHATFKANTLLQNIAMLAPKLVSGWKPSTPI